MKKSGHKFYRTALFYFTLFLLYACLVPFQLIFSATAIEDCLSSIRWMPYFIDGHHVSLTDLVSNIALFVPFGFFYTGTLYARIKTRYLIVICIVLGFCLSSLMEFLQLFTTIRVPSMTDVYNNTIGAIFGCLFYVLYHNKFAKMIKHLVIIQLKKPLYQVYTIIIFIGIIFYQLIPFDVSLDIDTIKGGIKFFLRHFHFILQWRYMQSSINNLLFFSIMSYALYNSFFLKKKCVRRLILTVSICVTVVWSIEFIQLFIVSRGSNISNVYWGFIGIVNGLYWYIFTKRYKTRLKRLRLFFSINYILFFLFNYLFPFKLTDTIRDNVSVYSVIPFASYFVTISIRSIADLFAQIFLFVPFGCYCAKYINWSYKKLFLIGCLVAAFFELSHLLLATRFFDITDILSGGLGTVLGQYWTLRLFAYRKNHMLN